MPILWLRLMLVTWAVGAVLMQHDRPVAFMSKALNSAQCNYHTTDCELLAIVLACKRWRPYLDGKKTVVLIDHKPLIGLHTAPDFEQKISQVVWSSSWYSSPTGLSARSLGGCPRCIVPLTFMYGCSWKTLQAYSCSCSSSPLCWTCETMETTKVSPLIQLQHCLQCWLSLPTCNKLAMLPLRMLIWRSLLNWLKFEPRLLDCPPWWCPTGGPVPWFSWADSFAKFWWFSDIGTWRISWV